MLNELCARLVRKQIRCIEKKRKKLNIQGDAKLVTDPKNSNKYL